MAFFTRTYTESSSYSRTDQSRTRFGGSRRGPPTATRYEHDQYYSAAGNRGSHMPLDIAAHWEWRNPINILPGLILLVLVLALAAMVL